MGLIPLSLVPLVLYGLASLFLADPAGPSAGDGARQTMWDAAVTEFTLVSGERWPLTYGDVLIAVALALMFVSLLRSLGAKRSVPANMAMVVVLCVYVVAFLTVGFAGTSVFFILTLVALVDALAAISAGMLKPEQKNASA